MSLIDRAGESLRFGFYDAAVIYAVKALELKLRDILGLPGFHRAGLIEMLYFARDNGVYLPFWKEIHGLRKLRNRCLHNSGFIGRGEAEKAVLTASEIVDQLGSIVVPEKIRVKARSFFKADPDYRRKLNRFSNLLLFIGTFIFSTGVNMALIYWFSFFGSVLGVFTGALTQLLVAIGGAIMIYALKIKREIHLL